VEIHLIRIILAALPIMTLKFQGCPVCRRDIVGGSGGTGESPQLEERARIHSARAQDDLIPGSRVDGDVATLAAANTPGWSPDNGLCRECARRFATALDELRRHGASPGAILPTPLRLGAADGYRGRGITIAFLDSGFYAHPDLVEPENRILAYVDVTRTRRRAQDLRVPDESSWHGTMTSVVAAGNGRLSGGLYRGVASEARLVLVKVGTMRRITHEDIRRGLEWVVRNRRRYGIRIVNVSCGGDYEASYLKDGLSQAAERASREGILVCAAVGNLGHVPGHPVLPPASAPSVLTVGGLDDQNRLSFAAYGMYHSSFGPTVDGLQKPEVIAPGIWVAAPILPGTPTAAQAELLSRLDAASDDELGPQLAAARGTDAELDAASGLAPAVLRQLVRLKLKDQKVISGAYKHVDGTSFASPIVASIAAQMLEANPRLLPHEVKRIAVRTARRIAGVDVDRQGFGAVDAESAVRAAVEARSVGTAPSPGLKGLTP
jgi:serine protease AprX